MSKKRRSEDSGESNAKLKKEEVAEFNGTVFKAMLREPTKAMKGLGKFVSTARKLPCLDLYDVVEGYIKISMECAEIFKLLEDDKKMENQVMLIFESLEMILLRTASDLSHFLPVGNNIVKKIVSSFMKNLQTSLYSENYRFVRQCLSLLSAMVSQGPDAAREVFSHVHFNKGLSALARRKDKRGKPDVRMAFIQFALSFLVSGDNATVGQLLEVKELLPEIICSGLKEDRLSIVNLVLTTLKMKVVQNKALSKTQKVRFFTPAVLSNIASLYKWNGIVDASTDDSMMADNPEQGGILVIRELVHNFLVDLCCSRKHGISFYDPSFGTAGRAGNIVLLQFLVGLKQATEDKLVAELVINILKASPDVLPRYFKETQYSYTPRAKTTWQDNVNLLKKIYEAQPQISVVFQTHEVIPLPRLLSMIMVTSVPPVCNKAFFTQGLNFANTAMQHTTLSMMSFILKRAHQNVEYLLDKSVWQGSDMYTLEMMEQLVQQYREALSKILPDMTGIVSKWQSLTKKDKADDKGKEEKKEGSAEEKDSKAEIPGADSAEVILLKALILQVICLYQKVVPHLVSQCKFDFSKLLKGIVSEKGMREEVAPVLQYQILQLALDLPASKFCWFRIQDTADIESASGEKSVLYLLLKMFSSSSNSRLKTFTQTLVLKVLKDSGVFEHTWRELEVWLDHLARLESDQQETVILFLERVLVRLICNPYTYTDKVAGLVQEAACILTNLSGQEGDAVSIPISHIDDVLDMVDVIMDGNEGEMEEFGPALSEDLIIQTFPFSAVVPAALEARNKLPKEKGVICEYMAAVLIDVLHSQREPLPLCLALLQYDKEFVSSEHTADPHPSIMLLHGYYSKWLPQQCREELFKSSECHSKELLAHASFTASIREAYSQDPITLLEDSFRMNMEESLATMAMAEFPLVIKQTLLYIKSTVDNFGTLPKDKGIPVLRALMGILQELVTKLQGFQETTNSEPVAGDPQEGSDLFLEVNQSFTMDTNKEQIIADTLDSIFKHPCLEQWFLALELAALPPHSLNPVRLKQLCAQLSGDILALLKISGPTLHNMGHLDLLCSYLGAVGRAVMKELLEKGSQAPERQSQPVQAFLSLHSYMDPCLSREVVSTFLLLPQECLIISGDGGTSAELSAYGQTVLQVLTESNSNTSQEHCLPLSQQHIQGLSTLLLSCSSPTLEAFLLQILSSEPGSAKLIPTDVLLHCIQRPLPATQAISSLLLENCSTHRLCFELWCLEPANLERFSSQTDTYFPLIHAYLQTASREDPARPKDVKTNVLKALKQALLTKLCNTVLVNHTADSLAQHAQTLGSLIKLGSNYKDIKEFIKNLPTALQMIDGFERWQLVDVVGEKLTDFPEEQKTWRKSVVTAALKWLTSSYSHFKDYVNAPSAQEESILERVQNILTLTDDITPFDWNTFVKTGLKYRFKDHCFLDTLKNLLEVMYGGTEPPKDLLPLATIHMMISSHSLFLPTMLGTENCPSGDPQTKEALVSLLLYLVKKCPTICNINHFVVLLGAYGATLSISDQKLLLLLQEYEKNSTSLLKFQSLLWGPAAVEHHKTRKSLGASLWQQTSSEDLLALLNSDRMLHTIAHYPQQRQISPEESKELVYKEAGVKDLCNLYDPCFLLPLFSAMLQPECVVDCLKFVSSHAFGVSVMALSSNDPKVRAAGYYVLSSFYHHLEGALFREKRQLLYLMDIVKNGIRQQNLRLPSVQTTYIAKVAQQMLKPEDHMYVVLNKFLLSQQSLDFRRVPEFFKLFYSFDLEHKAEREWILGVLEQGLTDQYSYELCDQQGIFQTLLGFSSSPLCDEHTQAQIIRVLRQAAHINKAAYNLVKAHGLLPWIIQMLGRRHLSQHLFCTIIDLLHSLWFTNLAQKERQIDGASTSSSKEVKPQKATKCLPLPFINEFLCVASSIIKHLKMGGKAAQLKQFLQILDSALKHRATALSVNRQANWLTLEPKAVSSVEALTMLQCWASLSRNATLLNSLQAVAEKHRVKEVLGSGRVKGRGKGSSQARTLKEDPADDAEIKKQERTLLTECKPNLCSIFLHWECVHPLTVPQSSQTTQPSDKQDPNQLANDTAHLLTKWSLRFLVEGMYDENRTKDFLQWFNKIVIPHKEIVEVLLLDPALKADLHKLYYRAFEAQNQACLSSRIETLELFTTIMIYLLEFQGHLPEDLHQVVLSACLSDDVHDQCRKEAGLLLLSLYAHELWSGVKSTQLFLFHVNLVTGTKLKRSKSAKSSPTQTAIQAICNDIATMKT
ncbi:nucleolar pre-ribosomal-associated protein 1 [Lampris incognitus]|uniref:nucleolar pre-ribosomal-associated protein 1 n=1 Tax=Lampris incognitus TaxID=2546036 RepID=UPI0024B62A61|nr:nucleolar pre-ribosomal-associated protein 1 [Lampris incognitus]